MARWILHADLDAFFASVEQLDDPALRGRPVVVGAPPEARGVVAAASYEARAFGLHSAMPMHTALRLCPEAIRVSPRFKRYGEVSSRIMDIFRQITPLVEQLSLDEGFLDISENVRRGQQPEEVARLVKERVRREVGLTVSVGVASSKAVAKIASNYAKPDGLTLVPPGSERQFLSPLPVRNLWGVGPNTAQRLAAESVATIGELAEQTEEWARSHFGARGVYLLSLARGIDDRPVTVKRETKSVSSETTFPVDVGDLRVLETSLRRLAQDVARRLSGEGLKGRTIRLKLRLADFTTFTRQTTIAFPTDAQEMIFEEARQLLEREVRPGRRFRLLGVGVSGLGTAPREEQPTLFSLD